MKKKDTTINDPMLNKRFTIFEQITRNQFGFMMRAYDVLQKKQVAIKLFEKNDQNTDDLMKIFGQADIFQSLNHQNLLCYHYFYETKNHGCIVMDYIHQGDLKQLCNQRFKSRQGFTDDEVSKIIKAVLQGLEYLHFFDIAHLDINPSNILIGEINDVSSIKLSLLSFSKILDQNKIPSHDNISPEDILYKYKQKPFDMWCVGKMMFQLLNDGNHPFLKHKESNFQYMENIMYSLIEYNYAFSNNSIEFFKTLIFTNPQKRAQPHQLLQYNWITRKNETEIQNRQYGQQIVFEKDPKIEQLIRTFLKNRLLLNEQPKIQYQNSSNQSGSYEKKKQYVGPQNIFVGCINFKSKLSSFQGGKQSINQMESLNIVKFSTQRIIQNFFDIKQPILEVQEISTKRTDNQFKGKRSFFFINQLDAIFVQTKEEDELSIQTQKILKMLKNKEPNQQIIVKKKKKNFSFQIKDNSDEYYSK